SKQRSKSASNSRINFAALHEKQKWTLVKSAASRKVEAGYTRTSPFVLSTEKRSRLSQHRKESAQEEQPVQRARAKSASTSYPARPVQLARVNEIRDKFIRDRYLDNEFTRDKAVKRPPRFADVHRRNLGSAREPKVEIDEMILARREEMQHEQRNRARAYKEYLAEMHERVSKRPPLVEQHERRQKSLQAENKIKSILKNSGVEFFDDPSFNRHSLYSQENQFGDLSDR
ncbi:hypothetical protein Ciccas_014162, partial [Cichlidogyrus casuarinus]